MYKKKKNVKIKMVKFQVTSHERSQIQLPPSPECFPMLPSAMASAYLSYPAHYMHKNSIAEPFFITPQGNCYSNVIGIGKF